MGYISWTKSWSATDDGTIFTGTHLSNLQSDITNIINGGITNTNISATAAIAYSKLALTGTLLNADMDDTTAVLKGWLNLNGTGTIAINDSYNVASVDDIGTGEYRINWDTDFANINYSCVATVREFAADSASIVTIVDDLRAAFTQLSVHDTTNTKKDVLWLCAMAIGDQS